MTKASKVIAFLVMIVLSTALVFAQESNASKATFGELGTDVDNFLDTVGWKDVELNSIFAYTRLGSNTGDGVLDLGAGVKAGSLYLGLYYNGAVVGQKAEPWTGKADLEWGPVGDRKSETIDVRNHEKANPSATYGALVGLGGMGIKFTFTDNLLVRKDGDQTATFGDTWFGNLKPYLELGGAFGPISKIGLGVDIVYNRSEMATLLGGPNVTYTTTTRFWNDVANTWNPVATQANLLDAEGDYIEPDIYLKLGFGSFTLENDLSFRIYGMPAFDKGGAAMVQPGVGFVTTNYDAEESKNRSFEALWDNRFSLQDVIAPSYNISGDAGKLTYSITGALPITIGVTAHSLNAKADNTAVKPDASVELNDYYKASVFTFGFAPELVAAVKYQLLDILSVQGGLSAVLFSWKVDAKTETKVKAPDSGDKQDLYTDIVTNYGAGVSADATENEFEFIHPKLAIGLGATFAMKNIALDFVFVQSLAPTIPGAIYSAVGDGLGNNETSIVLSMKF